MFPKAQGGLRIKKITCVNKAYLAKLGGRIIVVFYRVQE